MKVVIVFTALLAIALAVVPGSSKDAAILKYEAENIGIDGYHYAYETSDGVSKHEEAVVKNLGSEQEELQVNGAYSYTDDTGKVHQVSYVADAEHGFVPVGEDIPH